MSNIEDEKYDEWERFLEYYNEKNPAKRNRLKESILYAIYKWTTRKDKNKK